MKLHQTTKILSRPADGRRTASKANAFFGEIHESPTSSAGPAGFHRSVHYLKYKSNSEYAVLFDEAMQMSCDLHLGHRRRASHGRVGRLS